MGYKTVNVTLLSNITERECEELAVRDNEMHADLTPMEKILQCADLKAKGWTVKELCNAYSVKQVGQVVKGLLCKLHTIACRSVAKILFKLTVTV